MIFPSNHKTFDESPNVILVGMPLKIINHFKWLRTEKNSCSDSTYSVSVQSSSRLLLGCRATGRDAFRDNDKDLCKPLWLSFSQTKQDLILTCGALIEVWQETDLNLVIWKGAPCGWKISTYITMRFWTLERNEEVNKPMHFVFSFRCIWKYLKCIEQFSNDCRKWLRDCDC